MDGNQIFSFIFYPYTRMDMDLRIHSGHIGTYRNEVYRLNASMSEIEEIVKDTDLVRISKICIMNTSHLAEIRQLKNSHLEATLDNDEKLIVSRKYLPEIKRRL